MLTNQSPASILLRLVHVLHPYPKKRAPRFNPNADVIKHDVNRKATVSPNPPKFVNAMNSVISSSDNMLVLSSENRAISPIPSPSREIRGIKLFRAISKKLVRRSNEELSSTASSSDCSPSKKEGLSADSGFRSISPNQMSSSSSDAGSDIQVRPRHHHSTSAESIRRVFQNLNLNARSQSCNNTKETKRKSCKKAAPKRILRPPVTYTYVKGLSGLPTQRIPKNQARLYMNNPCSCSMQYMAGLNR